MTDAVEAIRRQRHVYYEDVLALLTGTLFVALGMLIFSEAVLLVGGVIGVALLAQYATGLKFWLIFFLLNLPFYVLAVRRLGWSFALRTLVAVALVSFFSRFIDSWIDFAHLDPVYAAVMGGALCGTGLLVLFATEQGWAASTSWPSISRKTMAFARGISSLQSISQFSLRLCSCSRQFACCSQY